MQEAEAIKWADGLDVVGETEGSRMTSSFLTLITEWQVVPCVDRSKMREHQGRANRKWESRV